MAAEVVTEVVRLRDEEHLSFVEIGAKLGIDNTTASRAYDGGKGSTDHQPYKRGTYHILPKQVFDTIESMLDSGDSDETIAAAACCSVNTVKRHKKKLAK